jgi:hypothetical protein
MSKEIFPSFSKALFSLMVDSNNDETTRDIAEFIVESQSYPF